MKNANLCIRQLSIRLLLHFLEHVVRNQIHQSESTLECKMNPNNFLENKSQQA